MNIIKENNPVLIIRAYEKISGQLCDLWAIYIERDAFWKIGGVTDGDDVIVVSKGCGLSRISGSDYRLRATNHNKYLLQKNSAILDEAEKRYLADVIRPFKDKVVSITKQRANGGECEYISIKTMTLNSEDWCIMPNFKAGMMYKGMVLDNRYTPRELGL